MKYELQVRVPWVQLYLDIVLICLDLPDLPAAKNALLISMHCDMGLNYLGLVV